MLIRKNLCTFKYYTYINLLRNTILMPCMYQPGTRTKGGVLMNKLYISIFFANVDVVVNLIIMKGLHMCQGQKSRFFGNGHPTFSMESIITGYITPPTSPTIGLMKIPYIRKEWEFRPDRTHGFCLASLLPRYIEAINQEVQWKQYVQEA